MSNSTKIIASVNQQINEVCSRQHLKSSTNNSLSNVPNNKSSPFDSMKQTQNGEDAQNSFNQIDCKILKPNAIDTNDLCEEFIF